MKLLRVLYSFLALSFFSPVFITKASPKLILHFDVNRTILAEDPAGGKTLDDVLLHSLADFYKDIWAPELTEAITYSEYIKQHVLPGKNNDKELKSLRSKKISEFISFLRETDHPFYPIVQKQFDQMKTQLSQSKSIVFLSFYQLIAYLQKNNIDFTIILRTFGDDLERIITDINETLNCTFFTAHGKIKNGKLHIIQSDLQQCIQNDSEFYTTLKKSSHMAIQDNWKEWNDHHEHQEYAKKFPIDINDTEVISMFFDDNIIEDPSSINNIVNPVDVKTGKSLNVADLITRKNIVVVDTIRAILDTNYYINKVKALLL